MKSYIFTIFLFSSCNKIENTKLGMNPPKTSFEIDLNVDEKSNKYGKPIEIKKEQEFKAEIKKEEKINCSTEIRYSKEDFIKINFEEIIEKILDDISNENKDKKENSGNNSFKEEVKSISTEKNVKDMLFEIFLKSLLEDLKAFFKVKIKSKFSCKCNKEEYLIEENFGFETSLEDCCKYLNVEESIKQSSTKTKCNICKNEKKVEILEIKTSKYIAFFIKNFEKYFELVHCTCIKINGDTFYIKNIIGYDSKSKNFKEEDLFDRNYSTPVFLIYEKKEKEKENNKKNYCLNYFKGENSYHIGNNKLTIENSSTKINTKALSLKEISNILSSKEAQEYLNKKQKSDCTFHFHQNENRKKRTKIFGEKSLTKNIESAISSMTNSILELTTAKKESIYEENSTLENINLEGISFSEKKENKKSPCCYATEIRFDKSVTREEIERVFKEDKLENSILWNFLYLNGENLNKKVYGDRIATLSEIIYIFEYIFEHPEKNLSLSENIIVSNDSITENNQEYSYCIKFSIEENIPILYFGKIKENEIEKGYIYLMVRDMKEKKEKSIFCCLFSVFCCCNCYKGVYIES
jgi:hypothetical protein